jgi:hypothetical protein
MTCTKHLLVELARRSRSDLRTIPNGRRASPPDDLFLIQDFPNCNSVSLKTQWAAFRLSPPLVFGGKHA